MPMRKQLLILLLVFTGMECVSKTMQIGVLTDVTTSSVTITASGTGYTIYADSDVSFFLEYGKSVDVEISGANLKLTGTGSVDGNYSTITFSKDSWNNYFKIKSNNPAKNERQYKGNLLVKPIGSKLKLINQIDIEQYLEGVLRSEAGYGQNVEYYKVQAVISRTFALSNQYKHNDEGYHLCDQVHCQAYKGKLNTDDSISIAIEESIGEVLVDMEINLITASFHSNCGGQTCNSEDVWTKALPYLRSIKDTFCLQSTNATWHYTIAEAKWMDYLDKCGYPIADSLAYACALDFDQTLRLKYFDECYSTVELTRIRAAWGLKSTYFKTSEEDGNVTLSGKGFGHGVGLCQEGAMEMSKQGYSYSDILHYYYTNVHLIDLKYLSFFQEE